jgi:integrase
MAPRVVGRLTSRRVNAAKPKAGRQALIIGDGGGLWLQITRGEGDHLRRSWTFRYEIAGKRREMGLGALHTFSLAEARERARTLRQQLADGIDPLEAREAIKRAQLAEQARTVTVERCAEMYLALHADGWGADHDHQWRASLRTYVFPVIGKLAIADVDTAAVMKVVEPIWTTKPTTAGRVRSRLEAIFDYAVANKFCHDNPARHVTAALPKKAKLEKGKVKHFAAEPWEQMPQFMQELRQLQSTAAKCMEFLVISATRSEEAIGAKFDEIDLKAKTWTIPAERMKGKIEHRVPLSNRALEILSGLPRSGPYVFGGNKPLQEMALRRQVLARLRPGANRRRSTVTVHGMRAAFKTWAGERTNFARETVEIALAHKTGNQTEQAYERGDKFEKRRRLMQAWADYLAKPTKQEAGGKVVAMRGQA